MNSQYLKTWGVDSQGKEQSLTDWDCVSDYTHITATITATVIVTMKVVLGVTVTAAVTAAMAETRNP